MDAHSGSADDELIRRNHMRFESAIKTLGVNYILMGSLGILIALEVIFRCLSGNSLSENQVYLNLIMSWIMSPAILIGWWLRRLDVRARTPVAIYSILCLPLFPLGTIFAVWSLMLIRNTAGGIIFQPEYQQALKNTPYISTDIHWIHRVIAGLSVLMALAVVVMPIAKAMSH